MKRYLLWILLFCTVSFGACEDEEEAAIIEVSKLTISVNEISLTVGEKIRLVTEMTPTNAMDTVIVWASENTEVAAIDGGGTITGLKEGTTKISGKVGQGYAEVTVTVVAGKVVTEGLSLSKEELSLVERETYNLTFEVFPKQEETTDEAIWVSSDETVATVDEDGLVTAVRAGNADIKLKVGELETICRLTVFERFEAAESISFEEEKYKVNVNETVRVKVKIEPEDATERNVIWIIKDETFASVHEGTVTGITGGVTTLRAEINDSVWCEVPVEVIQPVESISFYETYKEIGEGGVFELRPNIEPYNATDKTVKWSSSNEAVAKVAEENGIGKVTALQAGEAIIKAVCGEKEAICEVVVTVDAGRVLEIPDKQFLQALLKECDFNSNGKITDDEALKVSDLDLWWADIHSLIGIENFKYLRILDARHNELEQVDLSQNTNLEELRIGENEFKTLNFSANEKLLLLEAEECEALEEVDLSKNTGLVSFSAAESPLFVLGNIEHLTSLTSLAVNGTATKVLDVTHNLKLESLSCGGVLDFTLTGLEELTALVDFYLYGASAMEIVDLSNARELTGVSIMGKHPNLNKLILPINFPTENLTCSVTDETGKEIQVEIEYK
ncbi:MAG: Ig-like domain-containing protein [Odoribacter splanchnicus]